MNALFYSPWFTHTKTGKVCQLVFEWLHDLSGDRLVVRERHTREVSAHIFIQDVVPGSPNRPPKINSVTIESSGVGCTIYGHTADGKQFRLIAENADFIEGTGLTFVLGGPVYIKSEVRQK